jgi:hypothetical protein
MKKTSMNEPHLFFNGIEGSTGAYLQSPMSLGRFAEKVRPHRARPRGMTKGVAAGVDATRLAEAGWGVIFPPDVDPEIKNALDELCVHRRQLATTERENRYRELVYRPAESAMRFLSRHGAAPGPVDPDKVPYYLLIVGSPEEIPFLFQYSLDVQYAVGRVSFATAEEYAQYATAVVDAETGAATRRRRAVFFGAESPDDWYTKMSSQKMVRPLSGNLAQEFPDWEVDGITGEEASKARLHRELHGDALPALLFTAGHAVFFSAERDDLQRQRQGALVMSDWPGPKKWAKPVSKDHYFAASDLAIGASLQGLMSFHFACFSSGTPRLDSFAEKGEKKRIAKVPFIARLPQALLARGALAVIGHVDRAWDTSFLWDDAGPQLTLFQSTLQMILEGQPVGHAMEYFGQRHAELTVALQIEQLSSEGGEVDDLFTARLWAACQDARSYVVLGDPAVRLKARN